MNVLALTSSALELGASFAVGVGASVYAAYYVRQTLRTQTTRIADAAMPSTAAPLTFDEVYASVKQRDNEFFATFAGSWNAAIATISKTVQDIFKR